MTESIRRHHLTFFFVLAYAGSWLVWAPWWLARNGVGLLPYELPVPAVGLVNAAGLFAGPFTAAFLVTRVVDGRDGVRQLWGRVWQVRVGWLSYLLALVAIPTAVALLLGVLWCAWHAPLFLTKEWDTPRSSVGEVLAYIVTVVALSVVMSWVTNLARGSVFLAAVAHNSVNVTLTLLGGLVVLPPSSVPFMLGTLALAAISVLASRGRLGSRQASQSGGRGSDRPADGGP